MACKEHYRSMVGLFGTNKNRSRIRGFGVGVSGVVKQAKLFQLVGFPEAVKLRWVRGELLRSAR